MERKLKCATIDDDRDWSDLIRRCLLGSEPELEVIQFVDPRAALDYLRAHDVDLVITDLRMPSIDGLSFIQELRLFDQGTPVIMFSSDESVADEALAFGADAFVPKAALDAQLPRKVRQLLDTT